MKKIWILNHYAGPPSLVTGTRHFNFAKYLARAGYDATVFMSSAIHNSDTNLIDDNKLYIEFAEENVPFVAIRTRQYRGNGLSRILNMLDFYRRLFKVARRLEKPDVIIASSFHLLTCVAGIKIAKKMKIPCICEVRDLWPETFVILKGLSRKNIFIKPLYALEKWIYTHADRMIFTTQGGVDYVRSRNIKVPIENLNDINNGVDLEVFEENIKLFPYEDVDLAEEATFSIVYTGAIRLANDIGLLVDVAENLASRCPQVKLLIWGTGDQVDEITMKINERGLKNIILKGGVGKKYVPSIITQCYATIFNLSEKASSLYSFGISLNKMFDYLAGGKPIIMIGDANYNIVSSNNAGVVIKSHEIKDISDAIIKIVELSQSEYESYCANARLVAIEYDFKTLTDKLISVVESVI